MTHHPLQSPKPAAQSTSCAPCRSPTTHCNPTLPPAGPGAAAADGGGGGGGGGGEEELDAQTALDLLDLGIVVPVTRETAGSLYHRELARQVGTPRRHSRPPCLASRGAAAAGSSQAGAAGAPALADEQARHRPRFVARQLARPLHPPLPRPPPPLLHPPAAQLADFLAAPLARAGGIMPLPDAYCLYNRARGTELVSPDDLLRAVALFGEVRRADRLLPGCRHLLHWLGLGRRAPGGQLD